MRLWVGVAAVSLVVGTAVVLASRKRTVRADNRISADNSAGWGADSRVVLLSTPPKPVTINGAIIKTTTTPAEGIS